MGRERAEEAKPKKGEQPHPFAEVPGRRGQHEVELIALEALQEAAPEPEVLFEMTEQGFNSRWAAKAPEDGLRLRAVAEQGRYRFRFGGGAWLEVEEALRSGKFRVLAGS